MSTADSRKATESLIALVRCAVNGTVPDASILKEADLSFVYQEAERHMLTAAVAVALESAGVRDSDFSAAKSKAIRKSIAMEEEFRKIAAWMEQNHFWYMPLKGALLKDYYPQFGMRQMADYDILIDTAGADRLRSFMESLGYTTKKFGTGHDDEYSKPPVFNFEMHRVLIKPYPHQKIFTYYRNVKERLIPDSENGYGFHFSPEDFYLYMIAHEYKHYAILGTGLRSVVDIYVYLKKFGETLDMAYIAAEAEKLGLSGFEQESRSLALALFSGEALSDAQKELLERHLYSGTFGSSESRVRYGLEATDEGGGRLRYILRRLSIPKELIRTDYPFFWKHKPLIPLLYPYRLFKALFFKGPVIRAELKALLRYRKNNGEK